MARRRVNIKFVAIAGAAVIVLGFAALLIVRRLNRTHPEQFVAAARQAEAAHRWADAVGEMQRAVAAAPRDPQLLTEFGNDLHQYGQENLDVVRRQQDQMEWTAALEIDPNYVPAIKGLLAFWRARAANNATAFANARDRAEQLLLVAPNDPDAQDTASFLYTMTVEGWINGLETDETRVTQAEQKLQALSAKDPANADLPYCLAQLAIYRGQQIVRDRSDAIQPASATAQYKKAADIMAKALAAQDKNAAMHYDDARINVMLEKADQSSADATQRYHAGAIKEMDRAMALVSPSDKQFVEISLGAAELALSDNDITKAHSVAARLMAERGTDPAVLFNVSFLLRVMPDLRPAAIQTLQHALDADNQTAEITLHRFSLLAPLVDLEISQLEDTRDQTAAAKLKDQITQYIQQLDKANINPLMVVTDQGRLAMATGDNIPAVQLLTAAINSNPDVAGNRDILWMLAQAYNKIGEREQALDYSNRTVLRDPDFLPARKLLVELLTSEGTEEARRQISQQLTYLIRATPNDPDVLRLQLMQLDPQADADQIKALYAKLPETTTTEMQQKASAAVSPQVHDGNEAVRLYAKAMQTDPKNPDLVVNLARVYAGIGRRADAIATIENGLIANPNDPQLELILKSLEDAPATEIQKFQTEMLEKQNPDPVARNLALAEEALKSGDLAGALSHIQAAAKIAPDNDDVQGLWFRYYVITKQWDKLGPVVQKLAAANSDKAHGLLYQFLWAQAQGDVQRQIDLGGQLTTQLPEFAMSYWCLAQAYQAAGQYQQAINNYDTALQKKGVDLQAADWLKQEISCYYAVNDPDRALQAIEAGRRRYPNDDDFRLLLIRHESDHGDAEAAERDLESMLADHPDDPNVVLDLASARMQIAILKVRNGNAVEAAAAANSARDLLKEAIKRFPDNQNVYEKLSEVLRYSGDIAAAEKPLLDLSNRPVWKNKTPPLLLLGEFYTATGQLAKADSTYTTALSVATDAEKPRVQVQLASVLAGERKYNQAMGVLAVANSDTPLIRRERVNVLVQAGRIADAEAEIKLIPVTGPAEKADLETGWAQLEMNAGHQDSAETHVTAALNADPHNVIALVLRAKLKMAASPPDVAGALTDLSAAHDADPSDVNVLLAIADVETARADYPQAEKVLEEALQLDPSNATIRIRLAFDYSNNQPTNLDRALQTLQDGLSQPGGGTNADLFNDIAAVYQEMDKPDQALDTIGNAMNRIPGNLTLVRSFLRLNLDNKQYQATIDAATNVINQRSDLWWAWQYRGQAYARLGDKTEGLSDLVQALGHAEAEKEPAAPASVVEAISHDVDTQQAIDLVKKRLGTSPQWAYILILLYHQSGQDAQAVKLLEPVLKAATTMPVASQIPRLQLAGTIYSTAQPQPYSQKAYDTYKALLSLSPKDVQALNNFACVCADDFQPPRVEEGLAAIRQALSLVSGNGASDPMIQDTYGWLLILGGQTTDGMQVIRTAVDHLQFPEGYYHLGEGYLRLNQPQEAQQQVDLALQAISKAQAANQTVSPTIRAKVTDLSNRVLDSLRVRTTGNAP